MDKNQTIDLREYENPSDEVKNDNTVADTSNVAQDVENLKKRLVEMGSNKNEDLLKEEFNRLFEGLFKYTSAK